MSIKVTDVRCQKGDAAFLLDDGKTAVLYDTGFGFTGYNVADNIKKVLGDRPLDYIFLTHSHYDHALGAPYVVRAYPVDAFHLNTKIMIELIQREFKIEG